MATPKGLLGTCFELSGVVPIAVFVVVHVVSYSAALFGAESFGVSSPRAGFWLSALEILLVWLPLAFHAGFGLWLSFVRLEAEPNERRRSIVLRVTGAVAAGFVVAHAVWFRWPIITGERYPEDIADMLARRLSSTVAGLPLSALLHVAGLAAVALHLAFGVPRFVASFGLGSAEIARHAAAIGSGIVFALGVATIVDFATGSALPNFILR